MKRLKYNFDSRTYVKSLSDIRYAERMLQFVDDLKNHPDYWLVVVDREFIDKFGRFHVFKIFDWEVDNTPIFMHMLPGYEAYTLIKEQDLITFFLMLPDGDEFIKRKCEDLPSNCILVKKSPEFCIVDTETKETSKISNNFLQVDSLIYKNESWWVADASDYSLNPVEIYKDLKDRFSIEGFEDQIVVKTPKGIEVRIPNYKLSPKLKNYIDQSLIFSISRN